MVIIDEDLIIVGMAAADSETVIRALSHRLLKANLVKASFMDSVLNRETVYPTGLATEIPIALPHTDPAHCNASALAVAVLEAPVRFGAMGERNVDVQARIVFLPTLTALQVEVAWIIELSELFRQPKLLHKVLVAPSATEVARLLERHLLPLR